MRLSFQKRIRKMKTESLINPIAKRTGIGLHSPGRQRQGYIIFFAESKVFFSSATTVNMLTPPGTGVI